MNLRKVSQLAVLVAVACDGKLVVDKGNGGMSGLSGSGGRISSVDGGDGGDGGTGGICPDSLDNDANNKCIGAVSPDAGKLGHPCIPGGSVTESEGIATEIETLTRCDSGLACNTDRKCVAAPDCPTDSGVCVLRRAPFMANVGTSGIVALAADDSHLYWLEYGTYDVNGSAGGSGVYQHDGALLSYAFADHRTTTVAADLGWPTQMALTTTHAYVNTYGSGLLRLPLTGGDVQLVQEAPAPHDVEFATAGSQAFWSDGDTLYSMMAEPAAVPTLLASTDGEDSLMVIATSDGIDLFYWLVAPTGTPLMRTPITHFAPIAAGVERPPTQGFAVHEDGFYALTRAVPRVDMTPGRGVELSRAPKSGGEFEAMRSLGDGIPQSLQVLGDRYFFEVSVNTGQKNSDGSDLIALRVLMAAFDDDTPPIRLLEIQNDLFKHARWVGTAQALYWTDGKTLYQQPLPTP